MTQSFADMDQNVLQDFHQGFESGLSLSPALQYPKAKTSETRKRFIAADVFMPGQYVPTSTLAVVKGLSFLDY